MLLLHIVVFWLGIIAWNYCQKFNKINVFYFRFFAMGIKFSRSYLKDVGMASALLLGLDFI